MHSEIMSLQQKIKQLEEHITEKPAKPPAGPPKSTLLSKSQADLQTEKRQVRAEPKTRGSFVEQNKVIQRSSSDLYVDSSNLDKAESMGGVMFAQGQLLKDSDQIIYVANEDQRASEEYLITSESEVSERLNEQPDSSRVAISDLGQISMNSSVALRKRQTFPLRHKRQGSQPREESAVNIEVKKANVQEYLYDQSVTHSMKPGPYGDVQIIANSTIFNGSQFTSKLSSTNTSAVQSAKFLSKTTKQSGLKDFENELSQADPTPPKTLGTRG